MLRTPPSALPSPWRGRCRRSRRMRCSRRSGVFPFCWIIIKLISSQELECFSARSARGRGSGDPAPVPQTLSTPFPLPAPGLRARTRGRRIYVRKSNKYKQVGAPGDAPFLCAGIVWYLCRGGACPARCTQLTHATPSKSRITWPLTDPITASAAFD